MKKISNFQFPISKKKSKKGSWLRPIIALFLVYLTYVIGKDLYSSAFFQRKDRINIVVSDEQTVFYSLGLDDKVNYFASFFPDLETAIPGGYGYYRSGALAKLVGLEKKPDLFRKTYSLMTSSFIDYYFYPSISLDKIKVYFGQEKKDISLPRFYLILFGKSNAYLFDRVYLFIKFFGKTKGQFKIITRLPLERQGKRTIFSSHDFFEAYQGNFYKKTYRNEQRNVQILYTKSYNTTQALAQILEGEGIRVVDLSYADGETKECQVIEDKSVFTETAKSISKFLTCRLVNGKTEAYDIILKLGEREREWEIE